MALTTKANIIIAIKRTYCQEIAEDFELKWTEKHCNFDIYLRFVPICVVAQNESVLVEICIFVFIIF